MYADNICKEELFIRPFNEHCGRDNTVKFVDADGQIVGHLAGDWMNEETGEMVPFVFDFSTGYRPYNEIIEFERNCFAL